MHVCVHVFGHKIYGKNIEIYIHACTLSILSASCSNISALKHTLLSLFLTASDQSIPLCYSYWLHQIRAYLFVTVTDCIRSEHTSLLLLLTGSDQSIPLCYCYWLDQIRAYFFVTVTDCIRSEHTSLLLLLTASDQSLPLCQCYWPIQLSAGLCVTVTDCISSEHTSLSLFLTASVQSIPLCHCFWPHSLPNCQEHTYMHVHDVQVQNARFNPKYTHWHKTFCHTWSTRLGSAPLCSKSCSVSLSPHAAATCNGVDPSTDLQI